MSLRSWLTGTLLLRTLAREVAALRKTTEQQTLLLERLADRFAPLPPTSTAQDARAAGTGVDYLDVAEANLVQAYVDKMARDLGRTPTDDEILTYLADEKTIDLQARLKVREQEILTRGRAIMDREG